MLNQIIGVKFLNSESFEDLLEEPWDELISGKQYTYFGRGFQVKVNDLVIVPNSGYNDLPVVPAIVTEVDISENLAKTTRSILAVITHDQIIDKARQSYGLHEEIANRELIYKKLNQAYDEALKMEQIKVMAKSNPTIAALLNELQKQDDILEQHRAVPKTQIPRAVNYHQS